MGLLHVGTLPIFFQVVALWWIKKILAFISRITALFGIGFAQVKSSCVVGLVRAILPLRRLRFTPGEAGLGHLLPHIYTSTRRHKGVFRELEA